MAYGDFTNLARRTFADKVWRDKAYDIAKNPKYDWYQRVLTSMVYKCFDKKSSGSGIKNESIFNKELVAELHKPIVRNFKTRKPFTENIFSSFKGYSFER